MKAFGYSLILYIIGTCLASNFYTESVLKLDFRTFYSLQDISAELNDFYQNCEIISGPDAFENLVKDAEEFLMCMMSNSNITKHLADITKVERKDMHKKVVKEQCRLITKQLSCMKNLNDSIQPCLEPQQRENYNIMLDLFETFVNYFCWGNGNRLTVFYNSGGDQCLKSKYLEIKKCFDATIMNESFIENDLTYFSLIQNLEFNSKKCRILEQLQNCMMLTLRFCRNRNSVVTIGSLFKHLFKRTPCDKMVLTSNSEGIWESEEISNTEKTSKLVKQSHSEKKLSLNKISNLKQMSNSENNSKSSKSLNAEESLNSKSNSKSSKSLNAEESSNSEVGLNCKTNSKLEEISSSTSSSLNETLNITQTVNFAQSVFTHFFVASILLLSVLIILYV